MCVSNSHLRTWETQFTWRVGCGHKCWACKVYTKALSILDYFVHSHQCTKRPIRCEVDEKQSVFARLGSRIWIYCVSVWAEPAKCRNTGDAVQRKQFLILGNDCSLVLCEPSIANRNWLCCRRLRCSEIINNKFSKCHQRNCQRLLIPSLRLQRCDFNLRIFSLSRPAISVTLARKWHFRWVCRSCWRLLLSTYFFFPVSLCASWRLSTP